MVLLQLLIAPLVITLIGIDCFMIKRQQNDAISNISIITPLRPLAWGDVNFIHTTDTHGWIEGHVNEPYYNGDLGDLYSFIVKMKEKARQLQKDLFIVDTGDTHDGNGLSDVTSPRGTLTQPLLKKIPYDLLTIGNHELYVNDITLDVVNNFMPHWKDRYLTSNVYLRDIHSNKSIPLGSKYTFFQGEFGTKVLAYGFLFNFKSYGNVSFVETVQDEIKKDWFIQSLTQHNKPDIITLIGHIGLKFKEFQFLIDAIRNIYPNIPIAILGGHTHIRDFVLYDAWAAGIESGKYMETVGFFSIHGLSENNNKTTFTRRYLDQNRATYIFHSVNGDENRFDTEIGQAMTKQIYNLRREYNLSAQLGCVPQDYKLSTVSPNGTSSIFHLLLHEIIPKSVVHKNASNPAFILYNTGGIRFDLYQGVFTRDNAYQISTFENKFYAIENVPQDIVQQLLPNMNKDGELMRRRSLDPGYVTIDDLGTDGDDTVHSPIPQVDLPAFVGNEVPSASLIDIIYIDFFNKQLTQLLYQLSGKNWTVNTNYSDLSSRTAWLDFAQHYWNTTSCNSA